LSLFSTGSDGHHPAVHLLHLAAHGLNAAQDLVLCVMAVIPILARSLGKQEKKPENCGSEADAETNIKSQPHATQQKQGRCTEMFN